MRKNAFFALLITAVMVLGATTVAYADKPDTPTPTVPEVIDLHNDRAEVESDCPGSGTYWHFILAPNNGSFEFTTISLNLGDKVQKFTGSDIIPNGSQLDNVFVEVPEGYLLTDLSKVDSKADYLAVEGKVAIKFNLSHVCEGSTPPTTPPTTPVTTTKPPASTTTVVAPTAEVVSVEPSFTG